MGSNCCKGDAAGRPIRSSSSIYSRSRAGASLDERFTSTDDAGGVRLTVSAARTGDTDVYTLQASNADGSDTARVRLEVSPDEAPTGDDPPTFLRRLQDLTVKVGTRTRFLVEIISSTECKVTWYRNERRLLEAERVALARDGNFWCADVTAVSVDDAGRWTCTAENAGGRASCSAHLNVLVPKAYKRPEFVEELRALLTEQGTVSLECKVVGVPTPVLRWFKDSREIKAGDVFALTANAEDPTSLGTYTCEAVNCMGRAYSSSKVHVVGRGSREGSSRPSSSLAPEPPPIFTKELEDQFVKITEPLTLGCHIVVPPWPRSVVWYNKEGKVEPGDRYHVLEDGAGGYLLEIPSAQWPDEGEWKCVACSAGGRVGISTCYVTMDVPKNYRKPRFMENLQAVLTEEGLVSFECKVVGFPTPVLSWFKDGQELKPGDVYQLTGTNSLGSYCCIARNCMGQASSSAELTVEDIQNQLNEEEKHQLFQAKNQAPKFVQGLKSVEAKIDEPFRFTVKVAIPPEPSVLWYRDDQPVDESTRCHHGKEDRGVSFLDIQNLEFLDQAEWKCVAMNDFGHSVTSCFLKLIIPRHYKKPRFLENLQAILSDEGAVNLECKVIGVPQPVLKWYKDGEELKPGDIHRIISGQDGTCCLGTYTCEAQNCMGIAASSASLLGFDDSMKAKKKKAEEQALQRNLSLSTIHEERTSQMYDTPVGDITLNDDKGEISFSFDGKEVSVSLYETPDLTEEEALQIVEMYADQLSENITEHNVVELPPLRFVKETSTSGNLLMEAVIIDVSPDYFQSPDEDLRTEADVEDISIADENAASLLSLEEDDIGAEDYLEKTIAMLSDEKSDIPLKSSRKKTDSQRSADDFFSLSRDQSISEEKKDDDTQPISESEMQSFASAHSSGKPKSKSSKPSGEDGMESSEPTKTILFKDEVKKQVEPSPTVKPKRERRSSRGSRRSSSGSEKSVSKSREAAIHKIESIELEVPKKPSMSEDEFKQKMSSVSTSLTKVINDVQIIERDIILKSELMSSAATASRSLEIISSLISPLSEIHSIADAAKEAATDSKDVSSTLFSSLPQPLKALQQSLTIIEKCIDVESDRRTLVKKTCVAFIETCGQEMQKLISEINDVTSKDYLTSEDMILTEIESLNKEMSTVIKFSSDTIKARNLISEASDIKVEEPSQDLKHLKDTQKAVFELKTPLNSLLRIAESAESRKIANIAIVNNSDVILNDMSGAIQDLQTALEQIETLSVKEASSPLYKYNTEIIETVMESVVKLRTSFEQLSTEARNEDEVVLKQAIACIKENLNKISSQIKTIETTVGTFDVLASENKLDALQKMAQILIALENNLPRLETVPEVKVHMTAFHKDLTKILENVIESNDSKKYFTLMEICDGVNRINTSIKNLDVDHVLHLASLNNTLRIIQEQFINNVFDLELNCSVLSNVSDILVSIQEAINVAEENSLHITSDHAQDITPKAYNKTKANVVIEHIEHTIATIENIRVVESTQEMKLNIALILENFCPLLEEMKCSVAAIKTSGDDEEHISDMSDATSFATTLATPLCELNQKVTVLNQQILENFENLKENNEFIAAVAEPLQELCTTLEILQQDVISQYSEDVVPYDVSVNVASAVQNLQSCVVMIQEQAGVEGADEMSTLEDISGIKTTADTIPSDRLVLPTAEETAIQQALIPFEQELQACATAQALHTLNDHITVLQTPEIMDALDTLSEVSDYSSLKYIVGGLGNLHNAIEEIFHPIVMEGSNDLTNLVDPGKLTTIAEPMQELRQSLSVLDTSNIPIYENILEMPTEKIHSVIQSVSEFKEHLDKCMLAVFPASQSTDNTIEIANKVGALREVCENLKDIIETTKNDEMVSMPEEVEALEVTVNNLLDATDVSKGMKIEQIKAITEKLYENIITVQEEIIHFTPSDKLAHEAKLIKTINQVQNNIAVLEQYDFVDLSNVSDITTCPSSKVAAELESSSLAQISDIVDSAVNIVQDSAETPLADLMIIEDFFKTCKNKFTILRCLIPKASSHKKIIRLLQEFTSLQRTISDFKVKKLELNFSDDVKSCLSTFLICADDCLESVQASLIKIVNSQSQLLISTPLVKFENTTKLLKDITEPKENEQANKTISKFTDILDIANPTFKNLETDILDELKQLAPYPRETNLLVEKLEEFESFVEQAKQEAHESSIKIILEKISSCIKKHHDYKDASGTGKSLILIKCLSDCSDILQESLLEIKVTKPKVEGGALKVVLTEMLEPLHTLHTQLADVQEQVLRGVDEDSISIDISTTESLVQTMAEKHQQIIETIVVQPNIAEDEISLIMEVDTEISSIKDSLRSIESANLGQVVKEITQPVQELEKSLHTILSLEKIDRDKLATDVNSNIDSLENAIDRFLSVGIDSIVESGIFHGDINVVESIKIATELQKIIKLSLEDQISSKIIDDKKQKITYLRDILSKYDWQNSDLYDRKNQAETEKMKKIFLATYQLLAELAKADNLEMTDVKEEKAKQIIQHIDQYIELIEIVEEISAIIRIEDVKETMEIAKELRDSLAASEAFGDEVVGQENVEVSEKQVELAAKLQTALCALQVQVLEAVQELAPELSTEVLQRIGKVTAQLQADLVAVTGIHVALQAPTDIFDETTGIVQLTDQHTVAKSTPDLAGVATGIETTVLEKESTIDNSVFTENIIPTTDLLEKRTEIVSEVVTSEDVQSVPKETASKVTEELLEKKVAEGIQIVTTEEISGILPELAYKEDGISIAEIAVVVSEENIQPKSTTSESQVVSTATEAGPKVTIDTLIQHIDVFLSAEVSEVITEWSNVVNAEELKQSISIAKELRESIVASEVELKAETSDVLMSEVNIQQAQLAQQLYTALSTLENISLDTLEEISPIDKPTLQSVVAITQTLQKDLAVSINPEIVAQPEDITRPQTAFETAESKVEEEISLATKLDEHKSTTQQDESSVKPTIAKVKEILEGITTSVEDVNIPIVKDEEETLTPEIKEIIAKEEDIVFVESAEVEPLIDLDSKNLVQISSINEELKNLENVKVGDRPHEEHLAVATIETLTHNINEFLSDNVLECIEQISASLKVDNLYQAVGAAQDLLEYITINKLESNETGEQNNVAQNLQSNLHVTQDLLAKNSKELDKIVPAEAIQQVTVTITNLLAELTTLTVPQQAVSEHTNKLSIDSSEKNITAAKKPQTDKQNENVCGFETKEQTGNELKTIATEGISEDKIITTCSDESEFIDDNNSENLIRDQTVIRGEPAIKQTILEIEGKNKVATAVDDCSIIQTIDTGLRSDKSPDVNLPGLEKKYLEVQITDKNLNGNEQCLKPEDVSAKLITKEISDDINQNNILLTECSTEENRIDKAETENIIKQNVINSNEQEKIHEKATVSSVTVHSTEEITIQSNKTVNAEVSNEQSTIADELTKTVIENNTLISENMLIAEIDDIAHITEDASSSQVIETIQSGDTESSPNNIDMIIQEPKTEEKIQCEVIPSQLNGEILEIGITGSSVITETTVLENVGNLVIEEEYSKTEQVNIDFENEKVRPNERKKEYATGQSESNEVEKDVKITTTTTTTNATSDVDLPINILITDIAGIEKSQTYKQNENITDFENKEQTSNATISDKNTVIQKNKEETVKDFVIFEESPVDEKVKSITISTETEKIVTEPEIYQNLILNVDVVPQKQENAESIIKKADSGVENVENAVVSSDSPVVEFGQPLISTEIELKGEIEQSESSDNVVEDKLVFAQVDQISEIGDDNIDKHTDILSVLLQAPDVSHIDSTPQLMDTWQAAIEHESFIEHIQEFISEEIAEIVDKISQLTHSNDLRETVELANKLKNVMEVTGVDEIGALEEAKVEQADLAHQLLDSLSVLHIRILESAAEDKPIIESNKLEQISDIIMHLQQDLETVIVSATPQILKSSEIVELPKLEDNSMQHLENLLQEVTDKINLATERDADETEALKDALDEVQMVIIKLKQDYDGAANDTLNETLEDLECSVRSVQLQINEDSPPELLKEACATLQLLVNNMSETSVMELKTVEVNNETILKQCSTETEETMKLLDVASEIKIKEGDISGIIANLNVLKDTMKALKLSFTGNADVLIEEGVDIIQRLDLLEDKVFFLEKELSEASMNVDTRDSILTAIHSVYGCISNMRGTISSIQKRYMFENYGQPSEILLRSIKNVAEISETFSKEIENWKTLSKSLRKILNHFEDIKFYINLDKTARLPSDAAFTKIILEELKSNIGEVLVPQASMVGLDATKKVTILLECVNKNLSNIESNVTLEVKKKIPIFKELSSQLFNVTEFIKIETNNLNIDEGKDISNLKSVTIEDQQAGDIPQIIEKMPSSNSTVAEQAVATVKKPRKKGAIQEIDEDEVKQIATELVSEITDEALMQTQALIEMAGLGQQSIATDVSVITDQQVLDIKTEKTGIYEGKPDEDDQEKTTMLDDSKMGSSTTTKENTVSEDKSLEDQKQKEHKQLATPSTSKMGGVEISVSKKNDETDDKKEGDAKVITSTEAQDAMTKADEECPTSSSEAVIKEKEIKQVESDVLDKKVLDITFEQEQDITKVEAKREKEQEGVNDIAEKAFVERQKDEQKVKSKEVEFKEVADLKAMKNKEEEVMAQTSYEKETSDKNIEKQKKIISKEAKKETEGTETAVSEEIEEVEASRDVKETGVDAMKEIEKTKEKDVQALYVEDKNDVIVAMKQEVKTKEEIEDDSKVEAIRKNEKYETKAEIEEEFETDKETSDIKAVDTKEEEGSEDHAKKENKRGEAKDNQKKKTKEIIEKTSKDEAETTYEKERKKEDQVKKQKEESEAKSGEEEKSVATKSIKGEDEVQAQAKKEKDEAELAAMKEKKEVKDMDKEEKVKAGTKAQTEIDDIEAKAKMEEKEAEKSKAMKEKEESDNKTNNKQTEAEVKKENIDSANEANKDINEAKEKATEQMEEVGTKVTEEKKVTEAKDNRRKQETISKVDKLEAEAKAKKESEDAEVEAKKKEEALEETKKEKEETDSKAKKEKEEATAKLKVKKEKEENVVEAEKDEEEAEGKSKKEKEQSETEAKKEKEEAEAKLKKEKDEATAKATKEKEETEAKAKKEKEEAETKLMKEKDEAMAKTTKEKEESEAKAKKEKEEAEAKLKKEKDEAMAKTTKEKEESEAKAKKEKEEAEAKLKKEKDEAMAKAKKEKEESEEKAKKEKEEAEAKLKKEKDEATAKATKEKEETELKAKKEKEEAEAKLMKEKNEAMAKTTKEKEETEAKAKKEKEEAEAKLKKEKDEAMAKTTKEKEESEAKATKKKEESEAKAKKEKDETMAKAMKEKEETEAKAKKEKEEAEAQLKKEKDEAKAKAKKEKEETEAKAKKEKEVAEAKLKKEKDEAIAKAKKEIEETEAKAKKEKEEAEAKLKKEKDEAMAKAKKEKEETEAKARKEKEEAEAKLKKEKDEAKAKAKKDKEETEAKAKKEKDEAEAKLKKEKDEAMAKAKKEKEETEAKAKKEKEEAEAKLKKEKDEAKAKAKKEKEETEAKAKKEKEVAEAKLKKEKDEAMAKAKKEKEEAEAKARKEKEEADAKLKKEKDEAMAKAKKEKEEAEEKARKEKEEADAKLKKERDEAMAKTTKEKEETEAKAKKVKEEAEAKIKKEKDADTANAMKEKEESEIKAQKDKEEAEAKLKKEKDDAMAKATKEKEETEAKAKKEKEEAEAKLKKEKDEAMAKATKEKEAKAKKEKEENEAKTKKEREETEERLKKEKDEATAKAKEEKEETEAKAQKEKEEAEAKFKKEKDKAKSMANKEKEENETKAKKEQEEAEVKLRKEKDEATSKAKKEKEVSETKAKKEKEQSEAKLKKEKDEAMAKDTKEKEESEAKAKKENEEAEAKLKKEKDEAMAKATKEKEETEAKAKKEKEEAETKLKKEKDETMAKATKEKEETEAKAKKEKEEAEAKLKKDKDEAMVKATKEKEETEAKAKKEKEEAEAKLKKAKDEAMVKATKEQEEAEVKLRKEKDEATSKAKKEKEVSETKAKKEKEQSEAKLKKEKDEAMAKDTKEKEESEAKAKKENEEAEAKLKKEKDEAMAKDTKEKEESEAKAKKENEEAEAKLKKEKDEAMAKATKEKEETEAKAKKEKEEAETKLKKEKDETMAKATKEKEKTEAKAKKEKEEAEAQLKKEEDDATAKAKKEKEETEAKKEKEEADGKGKKEKGEIDAKAKKDTNEIKTKAEARKEKQDAETKATKEIEETETKANKENNEADAKTQKENKEIDAKAKKGKNEIEAKVKSKKEKEEEAQAKKDKEEDTKAKKVKDKAETKAKKEKDESHTNLKAKKDKEEAEALTKKEKHEAEARAKKDTEEREAKTKEQKEEPVLKAMQEKEKVEAKSKKEKGETDSYKRKDKRRVVESDLSETTRETDFDFKHKRAENGDVDRGTEKDEHYIKEYHYEPSKKKSEERPKFVDHNHKDYTSEFLRPSGYREKTFESERYTERESTSLGKNSTIYKAQSLVIDSQLRSSMPPSSDRSESEKRIDRHRSKALSEVRSIISEKRSGLSRDLKRKPVFSTYLTDRTAVEGSRVKLTCSVLSSTDPKIIWYKNGIILDNKLKYRTKIIDGLITLEVLNAVPGDSAEYSCTVENENGSVSSSANLKVYPSFEASPIPPTFTRSIRDTYHLAENELVLECRIRGQPLPTITWLKDDKSVSTNERYQAYYLADGVCRLAISHPTPEDSGKYTCKAENSVWSDQITHIVSFTGKESRLSPNITTIERSRFNRQSLESRRPHFTNVLSDYKVAKGGTIGLQVEIRGCPTRVEWLREGLSVTEVYRNAKTYVEQGLYTLALTDVTEKDSGMYTCRAWSTHGNVDMNAAITVVPPNDMEGKAAIIAGRPDKDILISVGEDINISFRVQGEPKPKVVFMKGIRDITNDQRVCKMTSDDYVKFTLKRSVVSDAGTYCVLARNAYGCDRAFVTVVVRQRASSEHLISDWTYPVDDSTFSIAERKYKSVPDRIPGEPNVVDGGNNWVSLAWPKSDPGNSAPVLAYKVESWLLGKEGGARWIEQGITPLNSFDAFNLKQGEEYHFRVTPRNRYGWGESVQTSTSFGVGLAGDRPEFVDILPGQLKVLAGETANLSCSVKGKPLPEVLWMKNGHEIEEDSRVTTAFNGQSCSLTIKDISIEDEARFSCEATNVHGRASTYARLAVVTDRLVWEADAKLKRERSQDGVGEFPPQFTMRLRDRRVQATYPVRLTCQVVGSPPPSLTWFKDGEDVMFDNRRCKYQDEHFHTLEIAPTTLEDGGVYEAMARNSSGAVSCRCSLVVDKGIRAYVAPEFCCGLEPLYRLTEGEELRISAVVEAYPSVGVTWYRDGVRLRPSRRAIMTLDRDGQIELALAAVTGRDAGVYTCTASNEVGRSSTSGKVEIIEGEGKRVTKRTPPVVINAPDVPYSKEPMFVRKPRSSEAREGDNVIIQCEVIGDPKPDVYWLRDFLKPDYYRDATHFKRVGDGPEYRFEIPHAKLDYTGAYSVVARNVHGEAKAIISLQILAKDPTSTEDVHNVKYGRVDVIPRFERELQDLLSYDGDLVEFECRVSGNPEPDIRWFHYNELIRDCPYYESSFDDGAARLKIKQVTAEDEGTYSCEASNSLGKATSSACLVVYPPGEPNTLSQRLRRPPALLSAASTPRSTPRSTPARSVSRTPGPDHRSSMDRRLCSPSRQMAPSFYTYPFNKVVEEGDQVTFQCAVKGQPTPWTTWDKDGIIITPSARVTMKEKDDLLRILEIEQVTVEDVGIYRITVENEYGRAEASARLEVITQKGKFYGGVRAYSASPRKSLSYRRYPSSSRQD